MKTRFLTLLVLLSSLFSTNSMAADTLIAQIDRTWGLLLGDDVTVTIDISSLENGIDESRTVRVQFITRNAKGIPWKFEPVINEINVHPGEMKVVSFYAKNNASHDIIGQAVPSVSPGLAANYFHKIECFCFTQQPLSAGTDVEMSLQFYVDLELPADIKTLTLSYTLYDITEKSS